MTVRDLPQVTQRVHGTQDLTPVGNIDFIRDRANTLFIYLLIYYQNAFLFSEEKWGKFEGLCVQCIIVSTIIYSGCVYAK